MKRTRSDDERRAMHAKMRRKAPSKRRPTASGHAQPYRTGGYTLHRLEGKQGQTLYFFRKTGAKGRGTPTRVPKGYTVHRNARTGLPYLSKRSERQERHIRTAAAGR